MLKTYFKKIFEVAKRGDAREESYYSCLQELLNSFANSINRKQVYVTTLPKKTEAGNPDFRIWDGIQHIVGYIEAKAPTVENLDQIEDTEQLKRYLDFPNLILTNFFEFRLYRNGQLRDKVSIARPFALHKLKIVPIAENKEKFFNLLNQFFRFSLPQTYTAKQLATELAKRTRHLKQIIGEELHEEEAKGEGFILSFYNAFQEYLINGLSKEDFADLYSQTITYGLFAARTRSENGFNRKLAYDNIPNTIGILKEMFNFISLAQLPPQMEWILDDISEVLAVADVNKILSKFYREGKGSDPIVHFYETFLTEYDPAKRERCGVYYTPESVVSYIVRSLNIILKEHFNKECGFADDSVTVLDPAAGTMTFVAEAAKLAVDEFVTKWGTGKKKDLIKSHILSNFYAFELMMAAYTIGHLKISFLLEEWGYKLSPQERVKLYLTNTLEMKELEQITIPGMSSLSKESHSAGEVKRKTPILAIMGNPPYSVSSVNKSDFVKKEMEIYKQDVRDEKNIQPLSDDYIKFIRFAHWKIDKTGKGVIGIITNNSYLSGLIHRGMRKKLLQTFNQIYILNLHGNARIREKCPDGSKDENMFDIMQGVSIALFVKSKKQIGLGKIFYQDVYGLRENKGNYLDKNDIKTTKWKQLKLSEPHYFFVKKDPSHQASYNKFLSISEIFNKFSSGVKTHRDHFVVGFTKEEIKQRMRTFASDLSDEVVKQGLNLKDTRDWKIKIARESIKEIDWTEYIRSYSYRPFDVRYICYLINLLEKGCDRWDLMQNFFKENLGLTTIRSESKQVDFSHAFLSNFATDIHYSGGQTYVFPLYLYKQKQPQRRKVPGTAMMLFEPQAEYGTKQPNINSKFFSTLCEVYKKQPSPEDIFYYIYAVLYSNIYRKKYSEFLKIDFPRVPFAKDYKLFSKMGKYGKQLVDLHLMKATETTKSVAKFQGEGDSRVKKVKYDERKKRIYINEIQYFEGIQKEIWEYQIGGYQVLDKWLKDRRKRTLSLEDIKHYCKIAAVIKKTIEIQKAFDKVYVEVEKENVKFENG